MSVDYSHSIRNRLFLVLNFDELEYTVTNDSLETLLTGKAAVTDSTMLEQVLATVSPLNEIFSSIGLTWVGSPFLCYPTIFTDTGDQRKLFLASNKLRNGDKLLNGTLSSDISVAYAVDRLMLDVVKSRFPNVVYHHEIESLFNYVQTEIKPTGNCIVIDSNVSHALLIVKNDAEYRLINQYDIKALNDVFYFTMLAIEQLDLDIEVLSLYWLDKTDSFAFNEVESLFENYIQHVHSITIPGDLSSAMTTSIACG